MLPTSMTSSMDRPLLDRGTRDDAHHPSVPPRGPAGPRPLRRPRPDPSAPSGRRTGCPGSVDRPSHASRSGAKPPARQLGVASLEPREHRGQERRRVVIAAGDEPERRRPLGESSGNADCRRLIPMPEDHVMSPRAGPGQTASARMPHTLRPSTSRSLGQRMRAPTRRPPRRAPPRPRARPPGRAGASPRAAVGRRSTEKRRLSPGAPTPDYTEFESFTLVRRRWPASRRSGGGPG